MVSDINPLNKNNIINISNNVLFCLKYKYKNDIKKQGIAKTSA